MVGAAHGPDSKGPPRPARGRHRRRCWAAPRRAASSGARAPRRRLGPN